LRINTPESMDDFFRENFPLESTLKQIDADIASNPGNPALWQTRATLLESHGKTDEALLALEKALALIPEPAASQPSQKGKVRIVYPHFYSLKRPLGCFSPGFYFFESFGEIAFFDFKTVSGL